MMHKLKSRECFFQSNRLTRLLLVVPILSMTACMEDKPDLAHYVAKVKSEQKVDIEPMPVMRPYEKFSYAAAELRDPFVAMVTEVATREEKQIVPDNGIKPDVHRRKEALESYALGELQFVGTLEQDGVWALVRASDGIINRVQIGNYMGQNHGQVTAIDEAKIELREIVADGNGMYIERDSSLAIVEVN